MKLEEAVRRAIKECIAEGILADFLRKNRAEVEMVSILEYDKEYEEKKLRKAEYEAGEQEGLNRHRGLWRPDVPTVYRRRRFLSGCRRD